MSESKKHEIIGTAICTKDGACFVRGKHYPVISRDDTNWISFQLLMDDGSVVGAFQKHFKFLPKDLTNYTFVSTFSLVLIALSRNEMIMLSDVRNFCKSLSESFKMFFEDTEDDFLMTLETFRDSIDPILSKDEELIGIRRSGYQEEMFNEKEAWQSCRADGCSEVQIEELKRFPVLHPLESTEASYKLLNRLRIQVEQFRRENRCLHCAQVLVKEKVDSLCLCKNCSLRYIKTHGLLKD